MENSKNNGDISETKKNNNPIRIDNIASTEKNCKNGNNICKGEDKSSSLKKLHFSSFTKQMIKSDNTIKKNYLNSENNLEKTLQYNKNTNSILKSNILINNSLVQTIISFDKYNSNYNAKKKIRNKYNNLYTSSNIRKSKKKIDNSDINNAKKLPNLKLIGNSKKTLKNKSLSEINEENISEINQKEKLKYKAKTPNQTFLGKIKNYINKKKYNMNNFNQDNKSRNQANLCFMKYHSQNTEGYLGRKEVNGVPFTFESLMVYNNLYSNKSEKKRHEIILDEFSRLRQYIERQPENKLIFIKEFLNKYYVECEKYEKSQLLSLCDFICYHDKYVMSSILKPYLDIKNMIIDLLNNISEINKKLGINNNKKDEENSNIISEVINSNNDDNKYNDKI
jgi:hypothetical protein